MTKISDMAIAQAALAAGFAAGTPATTAVAVALAESGGNTTARNRNSDGSVDRGLWQINSKWHPEVSDAQADNPATAAQAAFRISGSGRNWRPWAAFTRGAHTAFMVRANQAVTLAVGTGSLAGGLGAQIDAGGDGVAGAIAGTAKGIASIASILGKAGEWIGDPHNWVRVAEVLGGAVAVAIGLHMIAKSGAGGPVATAVRGAEQGAKNVRKAGKKVQNTGAQIGLAVATGGTSAAATGAAKAGQAASKVGKAGKAAKAATGKVTT